MSAPRTESGPVETGMNLIAEGTRLEGQITLDRVARVHGTLVGRVRGLPGSTLIFTETAAVEGDVSGDRVLIDGFVRGDIEATTQVVVSGTGRVIGNIRTPSLQLDFGAYFEGRCEMEALASRAANSGPTG
jgi:cytoskeletal protein CcmA (bactofilin family)